MKLRLYNTLSKTVEEFKSIKPDHVGMYICGPTVYDRIHIGNARPIIVFDILYRLLKYIYKKVTYVRNITDVDDKIYAASINKNISIEDLTSETIKMYHEDIAKLGVLSVDIEPKATEHIDSMIEFIEELISNGAAYYSAGHVYFKVSSYKDYGCLSGKNVNDLMMGVRVPVSEFKDSLLDFVLWKPIDERFKLGWSSPWGVGRPGWHVECSAMCRKYLGDNFDIHGGGIDLIFPHHENEIAQSRSLSNKFAVANYWIHNGHLTVNEKKMSKSLGNFHMLHDILEKFDGEVVRLFFLMTHYASPLNFTFDLLIQAKNVLNRWYTTINGVQIMDNSDTIEEVVNALLDNMNTPKAVSILSEVVNSINKSSDKAKLSTQFVNTCQRFLGIMMKTPEDWFCHVSEKKKELIEKQIQERTHARKMKDFEKADFIKQKLMKEGVILEDTKNGTVWKMHS
jgi:cysteinyl-tRNA synthetase